MPGDPAPDGSPDAHACAASASASGVDGPPNAAHGARSSRQLLPALLPASLISPTLPMPTPSPGRGNGSSQRQAGAEKRSRSRSSAHGIRGQAEEPVVKDIRSSGTVQSIVDSELGGYLDEETRRAVRQKTAKLESDIRALQSTNSSIVRIEADITSASDEKVPKGARSVPISHETPILDQPGLVPRSGLDEFWKKSSWKGSKPFVLPKTSFVYSTLLFNAHWIWQH